MNTKRSNSFLSDKENEIGRKVEAITKGKDGNDGRWLMNGVDRSNDNVAIKAYSIEEDKILIS